MFLKYYLPYTKLFFSLKTNFTRKSSLKCCKVQNNFLSLHPQLRNDGGIAQLVRAHDS